jgi:hypothetical protein
MTAFVAQWPSGRWVKFRSLTWAEYREFEPRLRNPDLAANVYLDVYRRVFLSGEDWRTSTAGMVEYVGRVLTEQNPFNGRYHDVARALELKRIEFKQDYLQAAKAVVASIFHYSFEEIDRWDPETFFERLAQAEYITGRKIEPVDPNAKKKKTRPGEEKPERRSKPLSDAQRMVLDRVNERRGNAPAVHEKKPLTDAQQMVLDRVRERIR